MAAVAPLIVTSFEGKLLRILRCFVRHVPLDQALPLVLERTPRPPCLSRTCVELAADSLAKGCMLVVGRRAARLIHESDPRERDRLLAFRHLDADGLIVAGNQACRGVTIGLGRRVGSP